MSKFGVAGCLILVAPLSVTLTGTSWASPAPIQFTRFPSLAAFERGAFNATELDGDRVVLAPGAVGGSWVSPDVQPQSGFTRLVASWNAETPDDGHLLVQARATTADGETSDWNTLGIWAADDHAVRSTSVAGQSDALGRVETDTLYSHGAPFVRHALRMTLERASADDASPNLRMLGASVSDFTYSDSVPTSRPLSLNYVELPVPPLSQEMHAHHYPQWGGGGEAWCSPTSTEMVVEFWGRGPAADDLAWVDADLSRPECRFRRPLHVRRRLPRHRQLAVQRGRVQGALEKVVRHSLPQSV